MSLGTLLGTLLGDMLNFRLEGLSSCETATFDHITSSSKPSSSPESMRKQQRLVTLIFKDLWGLAPTGASLLLSLACPGHRKSLRDCSFLQPFQQVFIDVSPLPVCWGQRLCSGPQHRAFVAYWHLVNQCKNDDWQTRCF